MRPTSALLAGTLDAPILQAVSLHRSTATASGRMSRFR